MLPRLSVTRYLMASSPSAYLVAMPKNAATSIHSSAPGPPAAMAVATPTMFPVPTVAERAVHNAAKLDTSPCPVSSSFHMYLSAAPSLETCKKRVRHVSSSPHARMSTIRGTPHT